MFDRICFYDTTRKTKKKKRINIFMINYNRERERFLLYTKTNEENSYLMFSFATCHKRERWDLKINGEIFDDDKTQKSSSKLWWWKVFLWSWI
jgi:hypothetical protein